MHYSRFKNRLHTQPITLCHQNVRECVMREKGAVCVCVCDQKTVRVCVVYEREGRPK